MRQCITRGLLPIAVLLLFVMGCSGGKGNEQKTATELPGTTPAVQGASKELLDLLGRALEAPFKVTYETTLPGGGKGDSYVIYNSPPHSRIDNISAGSTGATSIIIGGGRNTKAISCSGGPGAWKCAEIAPLGDSLLGVAGPFTIPTAAELASHEVIETERQTFAGQPARCFRIKPKPPDDQPLDYCFNSEGVPLYSAPLFGTVQAVQLSTQVAPDDFVPPARPK